MEPITIEAAAQILGTPVSLISDLIKGGCLMPFYRDGVCLLNHADVQTLASRAYDLQWDKLMLEEALHGYRSGSLTLAEAARWAGKSEAELAILAQL